MDITKILRFNYGEAVITSNNEIINKQLDYTCDGVEISKKFLKIETSYVMENIDKLKTLLGEKVVISHSIGLIHNGMGEAKTSMYHVEFEDIIEKFIAGGMSKAILIFKIIDKI